MGCVRVGVVVGLIEISGGERGGECSGREDEGGDGEKGDSDCPTPFWLAAFQQLFGMTYELRESAHSVKMMLL